MIQYQNPYSADTEPVFLLDKDTPAFYEFCCCDTSTCALSLDDLKSLDCEPRCETYFVFNFLDCRVIAPCLGTVQTEVSDDSDTTTDVNYQFDFCVNSSATDSVRVWLFLCDQTVLYICQYLFSWHCNNCTRAAY